MVMFYQAFIKVYLWIIQTFQKQEPDVLCHCILEYTPYAVTPVYVDDSYTLLLNMVIRQ